MPSNSPVNILLVDDEPANLLALEAVLEELGENLVQARSGEQALEEAGHTDFAAILLDVRMPTMSGFETARLLRSRPRSKATPIIFVTASDAADLPVEEAYALGAVDFLAKPLLPAVLKAKVAVFVELHRNREELRAAERRAVELAFQAEKQLWQTTLESIGDAVIATDTERRVSFLNREGERMTGWSRAEALGQHLDTVFAIVNEETRSKVECPVGKVLETGRVVGLANHTVLIARDGTERPIDDSAAPIRGESGRLHGVVLVFRDITEKHTAAKKLEQAHAALENRVAERTAELANERAFLAAVLEAIEDGIVACNAEGVLTLFNRATRALHTLPEQPLPAERWADYYDLYQADGVTPLLKHEVPLFRALQDDLVRDAEMVIAPKGGAPRTLLASGRSFFDKNGRKLGAVVSMHDVTARREARSARESALREQARRQEMEASAERLRESEERYRTLFETMDEGFCVIEVLFDPTGRPVDYRFLEANPAFETHSGLVGAVGKTMRELVADHESHWFDLYGRVALTGEPARLESEAKALGRWFDVYATRSGGAGSRRVAVLFKDITVRKRADDRLRQLAADLSEADRRKSEFLATLAHELRNPLAPLSNGLQVMRLAPDDAKAVGKARDMMERQLSHMTHLVGDLLDIARINGGKVDLKKERVELHGIVANAVETSLPLIEAGGHELVIDIPEEALLLDADPNRLAQVLGNLLNNAAKYTAPGGRIALSAALEGEEVLVCVTDNGVGIPAESLSCVFDMFAQVGRNMDRAQGGLGIGLTLVRRLIELHGGTVTARSAGVGQGSTFAVRLPVVGKDAGAPRSAAHAASTGITIATVTKSFRVLVVDDNTDAAESLSDLLQLGGHITRVASDGDQAIRMAQEFLPHLVFLDIGIPGKNGYEVARTLRSTPGMEQVMLAALTGWGAEEDRVRSRDAGFDHHLTKPAELDLVDGLLSQLAAFSRPSAGDH
jgi:PAS domain S-box-containing protein